MSAQKTDFSSVQQSKLEANEGRQKNGNQYLLTQARKVHRVYAPLYPDNPFRIILKALEDPIGRPEQVSVVHGNPGLDAVDEFYLGAVVFESSTDPRSHLGGQIGTPEDHNRPDEITIIAPIPRLLHLDEAPPQKTVPDFQHHPILGRIMWKTPVLFEQGKFRVEKRQIQERRTKHSFDSVKRAATRHIGDHLIEERDTTKPPAILIGFHWLEPGGAEKLAFDSVKWARAAGLRVLVVAERVALHRLEDRLPADPDVEFIRADAYLDPGRWFEFLKALIARENIRAIHSHHHTRLYDNLLRLKAVYPDLVTIDSTHIIEHENGGFPRTSGVWTRYIDYHHVISRELVSFYLDEFGVSEKVVLGRLLDQDEPEDRSAHPALRLEAGTKTCRLIFIGRMVHQKRAPLAVAILRNLIRSTKAKDIDFHLDMVGTGPYLDVVRHMISRSGLTDKVKLFPADADVPALLQQSDILILPSANEGLALVCYEAIENGVIPISTNVGGQAELVAEQLLVPASPLACVRQTADRIRRMLDESSFLQDCKADTIARYLNLRDDPTAQQVLSDLYHDIARRAVKK